VAMRGILVAPFNVPNGIGTNGDGRVDSGSLAPVSAFHFDISNLLERLMSKHAWKKDPPKLSSWSLRVIFRRTLTGKSYSLQRPRRLQVGSKRAATFPLD
jgi:hypothetical protein